MRVLIIGSGAREHALAYKISQSSECTKCYVAPGNGGTALEKNVSNVAIKATDTQGIIVFTEREFIDLVIIGPEAPLAAGLADELRRFNIAVVGPGKEAAKLESSKKYAKEIMQKHGVPTAAFRSFTDYSTAAAYLENVSLPVVIKADGLAAGKGVSIIKDEESGKRFLKKVLVDSEFADAGREVIIEDFMIGEELSVITLTDGKTIVLCDAARDHKPIFDGNKGPNTGGMGAYSPVPNLPPNLMRSIQEDVLIPVVHEISRRELVFNGILYAGLIITNTTSKVLEFNVRFGDPETQPLLQRMKSDILPLLMATAEGKLSELPEPVIEFTPQAAVCVVLASAGYPGDYETGFEITGIDEAEDIESVKVFHAGTKIIDGKLVTAGGRVLSVTALGDDLFDARERAYQACEKINFANKYMRKDIGLSPKSK